MAWLRRNFGELDEDSTKVEREQHVHAYILIVIGFVWKPYKDLTNWECISSEFLVNPNIQHVNVSLVVYIILEMHESNRVMWQLRFRQSIPVVPQDLDDLHPIDLRRRPMKIGLDSTVNISTCGTIGTSFYLLTR
ncbi:hypothetical protein CXB51_014249 [Gossypium anomalum]|uniref:Uncharacterized protein n=1 Tax=Gossypium anomalum TaxID=47600 RepID=A0A8J6D4Q2_9ROSI|nr:hypothetical protein CXB51_014249 [Gossypium anomalum]